MSKLTLSLQKPSEKQALFLSDHHKHVGFGGARGGGKSWAVRTKVRLMGLRYPGIRMLLVRRTYQELENNGQLKETTSYIVTCTETEYENLVSDGAVNPSVVYLVS